jgi:formylglycine-generating enzyme required for sulfatase activity
VGDAADAADAADGSTCNDKVLDGTETDIDCGGGCPRCSAGKKCKLSSDCASNSCETGRCAVCPLGMVRVPVGVAAYCIDATEVTNEQYDVFVAKVSPKTPAFPAQCKWKATGSFVPTPKVGTPNQPVRNVDWCDAWAYCDAQDKRLCGAIGSGTTKNPTPFDKYDDPNVDQWRHACSYGASPAWPYGATADPTRCNTSDRIPDAGVSGPVAVRALTTCIGSIAELNTLYDMSGNVAEWEDSCQSSTGVSDPCRVRGGSFRDTAANAACGVATTRNRSDRQDWVGFRCCRL